MLKGLIYTHLGLMIKKMKMVLKLLLVEVTLTLMAVAYNHHNVFYLVDVLSPVHSVIDDEIQQGIPSERILIG